MIVWNKNKSYVKVLIHLLGWSAFFLLNFLTMQWGRYKPTLFPMVWYWLLTALFFYICYLFLIPLFLFRKKNKLFLISAIALILIFLSVNLLIKDWYLSNSQFYSQKKELLKDSKVDKASEEAYKIEHDKKVKNRHVYGQLYILLLIFAGSIAIRLIQLWHTDEKFKNQREKDQLDAELKYLRNQVNPHFLFNSLNSIYSLAYKKSDLTTDVVLKLSDLLRYMLYETNNELVPLESEINHIDNYIKLQQLRITEKVNLSMEISGKPDAYFIEPLLLIALVENAFKFGVDNVNKSSIKMELKIQHSLLSFQIENTIVNAQNNATEGGIGLKNLQRRLDLCYPGKHTLIIKEQSDTFMVKLEINLKTH